MKQELYFTQRSRLPMLTRVLLYVLIFVSPAFGQASENTSNHSYSIGDVLIESAIGKNKTPFTPLSFWNFGEGWLEPWLPPPSGELHLQRGGWVNTLSGFFSREIDPTFTYNAGTEGTRDEFVGAASLFVPLSRRFQLGLSVPFVGITRPVFQVFNSAPYVNESGNLHRGTEY